MKIKELSVLVIIFVILFAMLCLTGCSSSCLDCACETEEGKYSLGGISCKPNCFDTFTCTYGNVDYNLETSEGEIGEVSMMSCDSSTLDCIGGSGCYNACFTDSISSCGSCENCGVVCGSSSCGNSEETTIGCFDGDLTCGDSNGIWALLFESINEYLEIGR